MLEGHWRGVGRALEGRWRDVGGALEGRWRGVGGALADYDNTMRSEHWLARNHLLSIFVRQR